MNLKKILEFQDRVMADLADEKDFDEHMEEMAVYLNQKAEEGERLVLERLGEQKFVRLMNEVKQAIVMSMVSQGRGVMLGLSETLEDDILDSFSQTLFLSMLAILVEEEVI